MLPDSLKLRLNATSPDQHAWVMANAGAGKTRLLVERVLRLLLAGTRPAAILCITYTKAAAAEMAERIHDILGQWAIADDASLAAALAELTGNTPPGGMLARARTLLAHVLDEPEGIRILTIHAFCQSVLARFPLEAGIVPHFEVVDERTAEELRREAGLRLFTGSHEDERITQAIRFLAARYTEKFFRDILKMLKENHSRLHPLFNSEEETLPCLTLLARQLGIDAADDAALLAQHAAQAESALLHKAAECLERGQKTDKSLASAMRQWLEAPTSQNWENYAQRFLTKEDGTVRDRLFTKDGLVDPQLIQCVRDEAARVQACQEKLQALATLRTTTHMLTLGRALSEIYEAMKAQHALLDFDDLIQKTRDLLQQPGIAPWILFKLDGGIDHVLVDEAQDTSIEQWQILAALTQEFFAGEGARSRKRTLFVVGDAKQSIFSFQGAEPRAFAAMKQYFMAKAEAAGTPMADLRMIRSWRSTEPVLGAVDRIFASPELQSGRTEDEQIVHEVTRQGAAGSVEIWPLLAPAALPEYAPWHLPLEPHYMADAPQRLAAVIAEQIHRWIVSGEKLEGEGRSIQPGDIMILVRRRGTFAGAMTRELKRRMIPVASSDRMVLTENLAVMDLMALGHFLLLREDDLNLAALLKSPLCNLSEEQLFQLAHGRNASLWERLEEMHATHPALQKAYHFLRHLLNKVDFLAPFELFSDALDEQGGRARIIGRMGDEYAEAVDEFLNAALAYEESHTPTMQGFLRWMESSDIRLKRDLEQAGGRVRIMTVHGAKGLEAPIVFLADAGSPPVAGGANIPRPLWLPCDGMTIPVWSLTKKQDSALAGDLRGARGEDEYAEYLRLFYVALTRARDRLIICGWKGRREAGNHWHGLALGALESVMQPYDTPLGAGWKMQSPQEKPVTPSAIASAPAADQATPAWLFSPVPAEPEPSMPLAPSKLGGKEAGAASPLAFAGSFRRGTVTHQLLQYLPCMAPDLRTDSAQAYLQRFAADLAPDEQADIVRETLAVLNHPEFAAVFGPGSLAEVPVSGNVVLAGRTIAVSGQIDRLVVHGGRVLVIDYKTARVPPKTAEQTPVEYLRQIAAYRALLQRIYPDHQVNCALLWTSVALLMPLPDILLDTSLPLTHPELTLT